MFLGFDDVINIMLAFLTNKAHFSAIFQIFSFLTQIRKDYANFSAIFQIFSFLTQIMKDYAIFVICTKNETICETGLINMLI